MTASPRYRTRWIVTVVLAASIVLLVAFGMAAIDTAQDRWAWRLADLDRNELHLSPRADAIEDGSVVDESPSALVVEYSRPVNDWTGQPTGEADTVCYRFPLADPDEFREVPCP
ncbi:hypothetical protein GCM10010413_38320 [Promicromonospora sukumoe]|uniref:Uncharacterized protein n=1 Tax=Promicromonospora sukumoe TaxID=88382 RepID=A0A7W3PFH3_9MICO|nr:hypothetical protein [Promicromonospora sukumoe]MBA8809622.1 hypothetical protein [Promicromonospora sukumoe]